jgi:hypothetical protein
MKRGRSAAELSHELLVRAGGGEGFRFGFGSAVFVGGCLRFVSGCRRIAIGSLPSRRVSDASRRRFGSSLLWGVGGGFYLALGRGSRGSVRELIRLNRG